MAINFPNSPQPNDSYTQGNRSWTWNGVYWRATSVTVGFTGSNGFTGSQGDVGSAGFVGSQGDVGSVGFVGSQGDTGFVGSQGDTGFVGSQGDTGFVGSQGDVGFVGSQGDVGFVGSQGIAGAFAALGYTGSGGFSGSSGAVGFVGSQGVAGEFAAVGFTGSRGFVGSEGSSGVDGTSVKIVGTVDSAANLPNPFNGDIGDGYITSDTGNLHVWNGSSFTDVGRILGYTGSQGPADGYTGSAGTSGSTYISLVMTGLITTPFVGTSRLYPPKDIYITMVYANVTNPSTGNAFIFDIKKNGVSLGVTFSIAQGQNTMIPVAVNSTILTTDYITLDVTGASATDLFAKIEYINT